MIIKFKMRNFGPFRDETVIDFRSTKLKDGMGNVLPLEGSKAGILNGVSLFGPNASGKSYVIRALGALVNIMRYPLPVNVQILSYMPFAFSKEYRYSPVCLGIQLIDDGVMYDYEVEFDSSSIISESLHYSPNGQRSKVFVRKGMNYSCMRTSDGTSLKKVVPMTAENSSFVSVAAQFNNVICKNLIGAVSKVTIVTGDMGRFLENVIRKMNSDYEFKNTLLKALNIADFGIDDVIGSVETKNVMEISGILPERVIGLMMATGNSKINQMELSIRHSVEDSDLPDSERFLPFDAESNGTIRMLCVIGPVIDALKNGGLVAIDEFGAFLHHDLCVHILGLFREECNHNHAQFLINTHDLNLIDSDILRRDQLLMVQKDRCTCASEILPLSDFSIHKGTDILRGYRNGQYGALPIIGSLRLM